jgi:hypothetical protein
MNVAPGISPMQNRVNAKGRQTLAEKDRRIRRVIVAKACRESRVKESMDA